MKIAENPAGLFWPFLALLKGQGGGNLLVVEGKVLSDT